VEVNWRREVNYSTLKSRGMVGWGPGRYSPAFEVNMAEVNARFNANYPQAKPKSALRIFRK
jgi:hypothetical protein